MRVLIAAARVGSLPARGALDAFAAGWRSGNPDALLDLAVCSSGAHDLLDAVEAVHGGSREVETVVAADGEHEHPVVVLLVAGTAYVQAGDVLDPPLARATTAWTGTSYGVGQIVARAADAGVRRVVVGAGDAATLDLGAGLLAALADAPPGPFDPATALDRLPAWLTTARARLRATELVLAAGTAASVRGLRGAAAALRERVGAAQSQALDARLAPLAAALEAQRVSRHDLLGAGGGLAAGGTGAPGTPGAPGAPASATSSTAGTAGAGSGGGLGAAVLALGGRVVPGAAFVAAETGVPARAREAELAVVLADRVDPVEADTGVLGAVAAAAARDGVALLALGRTGVLSRRGAAPFGISATGHVEGTAEGLTAAGRKHAAAWRW